MSSDTEQPRFLFVDLDQTLLKGEEGREWAGESWLLMTVALGASREDHMKIYEEFLKQVSTDKQKNERLHDEMSKKIIDLWQNAYKAEHDGKPITKKSLEIICEKVFAKEYVSDEAKTVMAKFIANSVLPIVSTGGLAIVAAAVAKAIGSTAAVENTTLKNIEVSLGNSELIYDKNDVLIGFTHTPNIAEKKQVQIEEKLAEIRAALGASNILSLAVSDGSSDILVFLETMFGISFNAKNEKLIAASIGKTTAWQEVLAIALENFKLLELQGLGWPDD